MSSGDRCNHGRFLEENGPFHQSWVPGKLSAGWGAKRVQRLRVSRRFLSIVHNHLIVPGLAAAGIACGRRAHHSLNEVTSKITRVQGPGYRLESFVFLFRKRNSLQLLSLRHVSGDSRKSAGPVPIEVVVFCHHAGSGCPCRCGAGLHGRGNSRIGDSPSGQLMTRRLDNPRQSTSVRHIREFLF